MLKGRVNFILGGGFLKSSYEEGKTVNVTSRVSIISKRICFISGEFHSQTCNKNENIVSFPCKFVI